VQSEFNKAFPFLRIEFLRHARNRQNDQSAVTNKFFDSTLSFGEISKNVAEYFIEVEDNTTVKELEYIFTNNVGLPALVFRKSGNIWMETTITANWTLGQQNEHAREISGHVLTQ